MSKAPFVILALSALLSVPAAHGFGDEHVVVKKEDRLGDETYEVMTRKEFYALEKACRKESFYGTKALMLAQRAWKEDETNDGSFPRSVARPIRVRAIRGYKELAEAQSAAERYDEREREQKAKKEQSLKDKHSRSAWTRGKGRGNNRKRMKLDTKSHACALEKQQTRQEELEKACTLYESMLEQCRTEAESRRTGSGKSGFAAP